jgi:hypothetical protein
MSKTWIVVGVCLYGSGLMAQEQIHPAPAGRSDTLRAVSLEFNRMLNTFLWNGTLSYNRKLPELSIGINQRARSRVIKTEQNSIQDEYQGRVEVVSTVAGPWNAEAVVNSNVLSDNRGVGLTQLSQHQVLGGVALRAETGANVSVLGGLELNSQETQHDQGFTYLLNAGSDRLRLEEIHGRLSSSWSQSSLGRRNPEHRNVSFTLYREFAPGTSDSLTIEYDKLRREFYVAADPQTQIQYRISSNVFIRDAEGLDVSNRLTYTVHENARLSLQGGITNRKIDRNVEFQTPTSVVADSRIEESQLYGSLQLHFGASSWLKGDVGIHHSEREELHATRFLNNLSQRTSVTANIFTELGTDDILKVAGAASILRYDTPDSLNTDERDELLMSVGMEEIHRFNRSVTLTLQADILLNHLVYLHRFQSANNAWNRVFRFSPKIVYSPAPWFRMATTAEVLANYTAFDFEEQIASIRSYSFRQAAWSDSTVVRLARNMEFVFLGSLRLYERGILRWKEFKERPENYFVEMNFWPQMHIFATEQMRFGVGYRYFSQDRYAYSGVERIRDLQLQTFGPTALIEWLGHGPERFIVEGWMETQTIDGRVLSTISNLSMRVMLGW